MALGLPTPHGDVMDLDKLQDRESQFIGLPGRAVSGSILW